ncbi:SCP2 sterol-binding domain-containing protein [Sansalvadorimonas sp. 2012CJ34-2]|uniref:Ubiquinone biosynthesis accessory factor UbiT n=1 Tax=Parendozoicomonas callyspongiae TaxID=2942213 RepID=A0ABT0PDH5_9GAMM|nr:SCP2 sterol-binding domain-containing protein [Sansalvadorimonas sp. 2012CJ34-2]MCL6269432.1 SCP2 sterol-binding domain-containing protein [Sansalvadorimonas sp. 2012CJ34-2]
MGITNVLANLPHPPASWLFQPVRMLPWELRNKPIELAINKAFREPLEDGDFDILSQRWLHIAVTDLELDFYISEDNESLVMGSPRPGDVTIKGDSSAFLSLAARKEDPDTLFFNRKLVIEGDTELGLALKNLLDGIELDELPSALNWAIQKTDDLVRAWQTAAKH